MPTPWGPRAEEVPILWRCPWLGAARGQARGGRQLSGVSLIVAWGVAPAAGTGAHEADGGGSNSGGDKGGKAPGGRAGAATGGPAPRPRTGHCVLIISSFLTPK